jgi:hypothetical protein
MSGWRAVVGMSLAAICAQAQPSAEEARLRAYQLAALESICAQAKPGDALARICRLPDAEAVALGATAEAAARTRVEAEARERTLAEETARRRALAEQRWRRATRETAPGRDLTLIAPPGFGPEPKTPE